MLDRFRRRRSGAHVAVWAVVAVALASIATGIVAIVTGPTLEAPGLLGTVQSIAEFSGTIVGFALLVAAWGMRRGYRLAYLSAAALVALEAVHGVAHSRALSVPLVIVSLAGLAVLVLTSPRFTRPLALAPTQVGALLAVAGVLAYGSAGAYALRGGFVGVGSAVDALYFAVVTASTVGYGDVHAASTEARLFAVSLAILGPVAVGAVAGSILGPELEARLSRTGRRATPADQGVSADDRDRVVVLGFDRLTVPVLAELAERASLVVVTPDAERAAWLEAHDVATVRGDPTDRRTLEAADLGRADAVVVATGDEATTVYGTLAVREVDPDVPLVALAPDGKTGALEHAGADVAIDPRRVLGVVAVDAALGHETTAGWRSARA